VLEIVRAFGRSDVIQYVGIVVVAYLISILVAIVLFGALVSPTGGLDRRKDGSTANWPFLVLLPLLLISTPTANFVLSESFGIIPPRLRNETPDRKDAQTAGETAKLAGRVGALRTALSRPGDITLSQMQRVLADTLGLSDELAKRLGDQDSLIQSLRASVDKERAKADESRRLAQEVQSLTRSQLEAVTLLITRDANEASKRSFLIGVAVSFPVGVVASLVAAWLARRIGGKAQATIDRAVAVGGGQTRSRDAAADTPHPLPPTSGAG
jgi:hypothetical protein